MHETALEAVTKELCRLVLGDWPISDILAALAVAEDAYMEQPDDLYCGCGFQGLFAQIHINLGWDTKEDARKILRALSERSRLRLLAS